MKNLALSFAALALLAAAGSHYALPRLLYYLNRPATGTQTLWIPRTLPDFHGNLVRGDYKVNGPMTDKRMDFLEHNFTHRPGDVWLTTYQKVGTTWTQYVITQLLGHPKVNDLFDIVKYCPWPEVGFGIMGTTEDDLQQSEAGVGNRCFKSHWARRDLFSKLPATSKVIYVLRDVEKVAVSYWHHIFNFFFYYWITPDDMSWDIYFEKFIEGDVENGDYFEHVASWWKVRENPNVLILRYEDMKRDAAGSVKHIAAFIGVPVDDSRLAEIVKETRLESMKAWNDSLLQSFLKWTGAVDRKSVV